MAIRLNSSDADAWKGRADVRQIRGEFRESITDYDTAIRLNSENASYFHRRRDAHSIIGNDPQAIADYHQAITLDPTNPISHYFLASALTRVHSYAEAIHRYKETLRVDSDLDAEVFEFYAWLLATCPDEQLRNPSKAIQLAEIACEDTGWCEEQPLSILAAAYAANGEFTLAVRWQTKALEYADDDHKEQHNYRLELYNQNKECPYSHEL